MNKNKILLAGLTISAIILGGCGENATTTSTTPTTTKETETNTTPTPPADPNTGNMPTPTTPPEMTEDQKAQLKAGEETHEPKTLTFNVSGGSFYYVPSAMTVRKGDTVKIVFENVGGMHNFTLDEFNIKSKNIKTGETDTIEFVADKAGAFKYYCNVGQHRQMGQEGILTVLE